MTPLSGCWCQVLGSSPSHSSGSEEIISMLVPLSFIHVKVEALKDLKSSQSIISNQHSHQLPCIPTATMFKDTEGQLPTCRMARPSLISGLQDTTGRLAEYRSSPLGEPRRSSSSALGSSLGPKSTSAHKTPSQPLITRYAEALPPGMHLHDEGTKVIASPRAVSLCSTNYLILFGFATKSVFTGFEAVHFYSLL